MQSDAVGVDNGGGRARLGSAAVGLPERSKTSQSNQPDKKINLSYILNEGSNCQIVMINIDAVTVKCNQIHFFLLLSDIMKISGQNFANKCIILISTSINRDSSAKMSGA